MIAAKAFMSFVTVTFALFLILVFGLHWAVARAAWQRVVLLLSSYVFYGWWDWRFCSLMLVSGVTSFLVARGIARSSSARRRRQLLWVSLSVELGILGYFKYFNFFADSFALGMAALGLDVSTATVQIILPVGISFYTFQSLSYVIDVYRGEEAEQDPSLYLLYLAFFPQLVAGPIERARDLLGQLRRLRKFDPGGAVEGCRLALWGLVKKLVFADRMGVVADDIFLRAGTASAPEVLLGTVAFAFQIYGDFSAYSDMAAGVSRLFGIQLSRNFRYPYFAQDLTDFWRRWHITFSSWLRDYVFIPLGGSRGSGVQTVRNILLTFLVSGLWHGAAWHFVVWGLWHAVGLGFQHLLNHCPKPSILLGTIPWIGRLGDLLGVVVTFAYVCLGWIWFRATDLVEASKLFERLVTGWHVPGPSSLGLYGTIVGSIMVWVSIEWLGRNRWDPIAWEKVRRPWRWLGYTVLLGTVVFYGPRRMVEFIYFQF